jgi:hypothetical protein
MRLQTLSDPEEMGWFDNKAGLGSKQPRFPQRRVAKTECVTTDQWLDLYTGWCETLKVRISVDACKSRQVSELGDFCKVCKGKGIRKKNRMNSR